MNKGQRIFSRLNNSLRTNISSINDMLKNNENIAKQLSKNSKSSRIIYLKILRNDQNNHRAIKKL